MRACVVTNILGEAAPDASYALATTLCDNAIDHEQPLIKAAEIQLVARFPDIALRYAKEVLHTRFPKGEPAILTEPYCAFSYARDILKRRWPKAEVVIARSGHASLDYARFVLHARFPRGEEVLKNEPIYAADYATAVIKDFWPEGEKAIFSNPYSKCRYLAFLLGKYTSQEINDAMAEHIAAGFLDITDVYDYAT